MVIGTPLQRPAEWLRGIRGARYRRDHPELAEWFAEGERTEQAMRRVIGPATNCIDIGCHLGSCLQRLVTMAPAGRHFAVEPVPRKARSLRDRFPDVSVLQVALGDDTGEAEFFVNLRQTSYSGLRARTVPGKVEKFAVSVRRLDDLIPADIPIGFIKIDVNGGELLALRGAQGLLQRESPFVLLECTRGGLDDYGVDSDQVYELIDGFGYRILLLKDYLAGGAPLSAPRFRKSMEYPFEAFNYAVVKTGR
jgi:FkbM family methyltransferase